MEVEYILKQIEAGTTHPIIIRLHKNEVVVGRRTVVSLANYSRVSREHAAFHKIGGLWYIRNMGNYRDLYVNCIKVEKDMRRLEIGDVIGFGTTSFDDKTGFCCVLTVQNVIKQEIDYQDEPQICTNTLSSDNAESRLGKSGIESRSSCANTKIKTEVVIKEEATDLPSGAQVGNAHVIPSETNEIKSKNVRVLVKRESVEVCDTDFNILSDSEPAVPTVATFPLTTVKSDLFPTATPLPFTAVNRNIEVICLDDEPMLDEVKSNEIQAWQSRKYEDKFQSIWAEKNKIPFIEDEMPELVPIETDCNQVVTDCLTPLNNSYPTVIPLYSFCQSEKLEMATLKSPTKVENSLSSSWSMHSNNKSEENKNYEMSSSTSDNRAAIDSYTTFNPEYLHSMNMRSMCVETGNTSKTSNHTGIRNAEFSTDFIHTDRNHFAYNNEISLVNVQSQCTKDEQNKFITKTEHKNSDFCHRNNSSAYSNTHFNSPDTELHISSESSVVCKYNNSENKIPPVISSEVDIPPIHYFNAKISTHSSGLNTNSFISGQSSEANHGTKTSSSIACPSINNSSNVPMECFVRLVKSVNINSNEQIHSDNSGTSNDSNKISPKRNRSSSSGSESSSSSIRRRKSNKRRIITSDSESSSSNTQSESEESLSYTPKVLPRSSKLLVNSKRKVISSGSESSSSNTQSEGDISEDVLKSEVSYRPKVLPKLSKISKNYKRKVISTDSESSSSNTQSEGDISEEDVLKSEAVSYRAKVLLKPSKISKNSKIKVISTDSESSSSNIQSEGVIPYEVEVPLRSSKVANLIDKNKINLDAVSSTKLFSPNSENFRTSEIKPKPQLKPNGAGSNGCSNSSCNDSDSSVSCKSKILYPSPHILKEINTKLSSKMSDSRLNKENNLNVHKDVVLKVINNPSSQRSIVAQSESRQKVAGRTLLTDPKPMNRRPRRMRGREEWFQEKCCRSSVPERMQSKDNLLKNSSSQSNASKTPESTIKAFRIPKIKTANTSTHRSDYKSPMQSLLEPRQEIVKPVTNKIISNPIAAVKNKVDSSYSKNQPKEIREAIKMRPPSFDKLSGSRISFHKPTIGKSANHQNKTFKSKSSDAKKVPGNKNHINNFNHRAAVKTNLTEKVNRVFAERKNSAQKVGCNTAVRASPTEKVGCTAASRTSPTEKAGYIAAKKKNHTEKVSYNAAAKNFTEKSSYGAGDKNNHLENVAPFSTERKKSVRDVHNKLNSTSSITKERNSSITSPLQQESILLRNDNNSKYINKQFPNKNLAVVTPFKDQNSEIRNKDYNPFQFNSISLIKELLVWKPKWLVQQKENTKPPPRLTKIPLEFPLEFRSCQDYSSSFYPLLLLDIWDLMYKESKPILGSNYMNWNNFYCRVLSSVDKHGMLELQCEAAVSEKLRYCPGEGAIILINIQDEERKVENCIFGYVSSHFIDTSKDISDSSEWQKIPTKWLEKAKLCHFTVYIKKKREVIRFRTLMLAHGLCNITQKLSLLNSLSNFQYSPLSEVVIQPSKLNSNFVNLKDMTRQAFIQSICDHVVEHSQPNIFLLHGYPGSGKTHVISELLELLLFSSSYKIRVFVCAKFVSEIEELGFRILDLKDRCSFRSKSVKFTIIGDSKRVHSKLKPFFLDNLVEKNCVIQNQKAVEVMESLKNLELTINSLLFESNQSQGRNETSGESKRELQNKLDILMKEYVYYKELSTKVMDSNAQINWKLKVLNEFDVIISTFNCFQEVSSFLSNQDSTLTCCIVDGAGNCSELDLLQCLTKQFRNLVLIGDINKFSPESSLKNSLSDGYQRSMFERLCSFLERHPPNPVFSLKEQYRMHSEICNLPSRLFYKNKIITSSETDERYKYFPFKPYVVLDVSDNPDQTSEADVFDANAMLNYVCTFIVRAVSSTSVGVIAAENQVEEYKNFLSKNPFCKDVEINTVEDFRSKEKDVIVASFLKTETVRDWDDFIANEEKLCITLTRARQCLLLYGRISSLQHIKHWRDLLEDAMHRNVYFPISSTSHIPLILKQFLSKPS